MECPSCHHPNIDGARFCASCGALIPSAASGGDDPLIGQIVGGRYRITKLLGEGGMGRVYIGEQQMGTNVRKVAVKTLQEQYAKDPQILARFHRECGTVSELEHPNTIQFFDFGQTPSGELYIAMEFVQGESLADALVKGGPMSPERVVNIMRQICGSLEEAHAHGVIHRDLKPDNVILTTRAGQADFVKVLDFGIAKRSEAKDTAQEQKLTKQGMVLGTPPYMSPEQFTGRELDARSDIYSLGVMTYEMLAGRLPFEADTPWQWATQHMTAQPFPFEAIPAAANLPPIMKAAILKALSKSPEGRQANVRQFFDDLGANVDKTLGTPLAAHASAPGWRSGTAAMPTPPQFAQAAASPSDPGYVVTPGPFGAAPVPTLGGGQSLPIAHTPASGATGGREGSGKGLIFGLAGLAGVLAIVGIVIAARGMKPKEEETVTNPFAPQQPNAGGAVSVAILPPPEPPKVAVPDEPNEPAVGAANKPKHPTAAPSATPPPAPTLKGEPACAEARRLAQNGEIAPAVHMFSGCDGPSAPAVKSAIGRAAPMAVQRKIFNGDCAGAKALATSVAAIGAGGEGMAAYDRSICKK